MLSVWHKVQDRTTLRESSRVRLHYINEKIIRRIHWHWIINFKYGSYTTKNSAHIWVDNMVCNRIMCFKFSIKFTLQKNYISNLRSRLSEICTVNKIYKTKFTLQKFTNRAFKLKKCPKSACNSDVEIGDFWTSFFSLEWWKNSPDRDALS